MEHEREGGAAQRVQLQGRRCLGGTFMMTFREKAPVAQENRVRLKKNRDLTGTA